MKKNNYEECLVQGIEAFISRNRCSLSNEDLVLLKNCLNFIKSSKETNKLSLESIGKISELLLKFLYASDKIMDLLH